MDGARQLIARGIAAHRMGRLQEAIATYRAALVKDASQFDGWRLLGAAQLECNDPTAAAESLGRALAIRSDVVEAWVLHTHALEAAQRFAEAAAGLRRWRALNPDPLLVVREASALR